MLMIRCRLIAEIKINRFFAKRACKRKSWAAFIWICCVNLQDLWCQQLILTMHSKWLILTLQTGILQNSSVNKQLEIELRGNTDNDSPKRLWSLDKTQCEQRKPLAEAHKKKVERYF